MRTETITCDGCQAQISVIHRHGSIDGEFCSKCLQKLLMAPEESCVHEDNMSDEAAGRTTARLICKQCGYDRVEEVA